MRFACSSKNKKGISMIELIGTIGMMGMVFVLLGSVVFYVSRSTQKIYSTSKNGVANVLLYSTVLTEVNQLAPDTATVDAENNTITFKRSYIFDDELEKQELADTDAETLMLSLTEEKKILVTRKTKGGTKTTNFIPLSSDTEVSEISFDASMVVNTTTYVKVKGKLASGSKAVEFSFIVPIFAA